MFRPGEAFALPRLLLSFRWGALGAAGPSGVPPLDVFNKVPIWYVAFPRLGTGVPVGAGPVGWRWGDSPVLFWLGEGDGVVIGCGFSAVAGDRVNRKAMPSWRHLGQD